MIAVAGLGCLPVNGAVITFESLPGGGTPTDNQRGQPTYQDGGTTASFGFLADTGNPFTTSVNVAAVVFEQRQKPNQNNTQDRTFAYTSLGSTDVDRTDTNGNNIADGQGGAWFIRTQRGYSSALTGQTGNETNQNITTGQFLVTYTGVLPTSLSGELWDIDSSNGDVERYTVRAYDGLGNVIASQISPAGLGESAGNTLDGRPWTFSFDGLSQGVAYVGIQQTGGPPRGFAFDNFNATSGVPEPSTSILAFMGIGCLLMRRNR
ncbi:hypothetical protein NT6N_21960 [Oceaniferula spumae]|uniref:PEP-CTERM protein-sorting domain-containing protein n=1 Tax=Oceaniferula spumae TaxID=2979115 RepID=A0AAT9FML3_9BACT